eukprot:scaffold13359_cov258-Alexandrium_tamarense.AAC.5
MVKQSSIKTTTWADQAQGFDFPSKQHTARGRTGGDETAEASHLHREGTEIVMPPLMNHRAVCGILHTVRMIAHALTASAVGVMELVSAEKLTVGVGAVGEAGVNTEDHLPTIAACTNPPPPSPPQGVHRGVTRRPRSTAQTPCRPPNHIEWS